MNETSKRLNTSKVNLAWGLIISKDVIVFTSLFFSRSGLAGSKWLKMLVQANLEQDIVGTADGWRAGIQPCAGDINVEDFGLGRPFIPQCQAKGYVRRFNAKTTGEPGCNIAVR